MVRRPAGFTLVEVSLVMSLTLTLLALMGFYLVRGQRFAAETETYSSVQSSANTLLRRMTNELYRSSSKQVVVEPGVGLIFLSFGAKPGEDPPLDLQLDPETGKILWTKWVGFTFDKASETITRGELALTENLLDLDTPAQPAIDISLFRTLPEVRRQPQPGRVKSFTASKVGNRVHLRLRTHSTAPIATQTDEQRQVEVSVETEVSLLN